MKSKGKSSGRFLWTYPRQYAIFTLDLQGLEQSMTLHNSISDQYYTEFEINFSFQGYHLDFAGTFHKELVEINVYDPASICIYLSF